MVYFVQNKIYLKDHVDHNVDITHRYIWMAEVREDDNITSFKARILKQRSCSIGSTRTRSGCICYDLYDLSNTDIQSLLHLNILNLFITLYIYIYIYIAHIL